MKIKRYAPGSSNYAPRRKDEDWEAHRQLLTRMHQQHYTRRQMLAALKNAGFIVTTGQLLAQMKKWNLMVNIVPADTIINDENKCPCDATNLQPVQVVEPDDTHDAGFIGGLRLVASNPDIRLGVCSTEKHEETTDDFTSQERLSSQEVATPLTNVDLAESENTTSPDQAHDDFAEVELEPETETVTGTLNAHAASLRIHLPTIVEPWCDPFPISCCCRSLFTAQDSFAKSPRLYHILLEQSAPHTLLYVLALLNFADTETQPAEESTLRDMLWSTTEYYLEICTRTEIKNSVATRLLHALLQTWNRLYEDRFPLPNVSSFRSSVTSRSALLDKVVKTRPKKPSLAKLRRSRWQAKAELDIGAITGFIAKRPSTWPLINWSGGQFGSMDGWWPVDNPQKTGLVETAAALSDHMTRIWATEQQDPQKSRLPSLEDLRACNVPLIFDTLGLMLALELSSYAMDFTPTGSLLNSPAWPKELSKFIDTAVRTLSLNAEYAEKFQKTYWLISAEQIGYSGKCKSVHMGQCTAAKEWQVLERSIHDWDEPRTWIERRLFTNRNSWPQTEDLVTGDNMSMRSVSSFNSFKRFQALALHLKIGTPHSRSERTKSTRSKMSVDSHLSWQLEHMLDIKAEDPAADRADLEPLAEVEEDATGIKSSTPITKDFGQDNQGMLGPTHIVLTRVDERAKLETMVQKCKNTGVTEAEKHLCL